MPKKRVHEIAKEQGITSKEVLAAFKDAGVYVKAASSTVEERDIRRAFPNGPVVKVEESKKDAEAPAEAPVAERDSEGKAKVPRAKATKRAKDTEAAAAKEAEAAAKAEATAKAKAKADADAKAKVEAAA